MWSCLPSSGDRRTAVGASGKASVSRRDSCPSALRRVVGHHPMNAPERRGRRSNEVSHLKMRVALLGVLALFVVSGTAASSASALGPYWRTGGAGVRLEKGARQIKLQLKSSKAILRSEKLELELTCNESHSEGATIEGNGTNQGQDKGRVSYSSCNVVKPAGCVVTEPIVTNPTKSYLAVNEGAQQNLVDVFEPTEGAIFVKIGFTGKACGVLAGAQPVDGSVYAELVPKEVENQEGLLNFPAKPVAKVKHEGVEKTVGLTVAGDAAEFVATYGARLATFPEKYGVFLN
jgi:hypothetical protein